MNTFFILLYNVFNEISKNVFEQSSLKLKLIYSTIVGLSFAPIISFLFRTISEMAEIAIPEKTTIYITIILLLLNVACGIYKHLKFKTFNLRKLIWGFTEKTAISIVSLILFNIMNSIADGSGFLQDTFTISSQSILFVYLAGDTVKLLHEITAGKFPPPIIMERFEGYNKKGEVENV